MAFVNRKGKDLVIALSRKEGEESGLEEGKRYDFLKAEEGSWLLVEADKAKATQAQEPEKKEEAVQKSATTETKENTSAEEKISEMIESRNLGNLVEGKFEELLKEEELAVFKKMLADGKVIAFKLSDKYKKAVYKMAQPNTKTIENAGADEKHLEEYTLEKDGVLVIKNEHRAKKVSAQLAPKIKEGKIKGIRGFDGVFYIIEDKLYQKYREKAIKLLESCNKLDLTELATKLNVSKTLAKIVCEFLKDEGEIIEKSKENYQFICEE